MRPLLVTVELDGKLTGATVAFGLTGTGVASPERMVSVAHWIGCCFPSISRGCSDLANGFSTGGSKCSCLRFLR